MGRWRSLIVVIVAACGRFGFSDSCPDGEVGDGTHAVNLPTPIGPTT